MWRNKTIFKEDFRRPNNPTYVILKMSMVVDRCEQTHLDGLVKTILFTLVGSNLKMGGSSLIVMALIKVQLIYQDVGDSSATATVFV
jgi:hypothetical protein